MKESERLIANIQKDLLQSRNYIAGEIIKISKAKKRIVTKDDDEISTFTGAFLHSLNTKAINLPSTERGIEEKIQERISLGDSSALYENIREEVKKHRAKIEKELSEDKSIKDLVTYKMKSDLLDGGISVFKNATQGLYADEKNIIKNAILASQDSIPKSIAATILSDYEKYQPIFTAITNSTFNKHFATQDKDNPLLYIYNPEKFTPENINLFNQELNKELLVAQILYQSIQKANEGMVVKIGAKQTKKIIETLKPTLLKMNDDQLGQEGLIDHIADDLKKHRTIASKVTGHRYKVPKEKLEQSSAKMVVEQQQENPPVSTDKTFIAKSNDEKDKFKKELEEKLGSKKTPIIDQKLESESKPAAKEKKLDIHTQSMEKAKKIKRAMRSFGTKVFNAISVIISKEKISKKRGDKSL